MFHVTAIFGPTWDANEPLTSGRHGFAMGRASILANAAFAGPTVWRSDRDGFINVPDLAVCAALEASPQAMRAVRLRRHFEGIESDGWRLAVGTDQGIVELIDLRR